MIRRHPHVFSDSEVRDVPEVLSRWEEIKKKEQENTDKETDTSVLSGIPKGLPALTYAHRVQAKAARGGFDWSNLCEVVEKLDEEIAEFKESVKGVNNERRESEFGDLLFTMVNISRFLGVDPDGILRKATRRFSDRFRLMEKMILERGLCLKELDLKELDRLWEEVKNEVS